MGKRIYKTSEGAMLAGVCAGLAEYLGIDVTLVRLGFILVSLMGGAGVLGYIVAAVIMPDKWQVTDGHRPTGRTESAFRQQAEPRPADTTTGNSGQDAYTTEPVFRQVKPQAVQHNGDGQRMLALILIAVGSYMLLNRYFNLSYLLRHTLRDWWPLIPLGLGVVLLISSLTRPKEM